MSEDSRKKYFSGAIVDLDMQNDFNVFSSLLARGNTRNVKDRNQGLIAAGLLSFFKGRQRKLQQNLLKNLTNLDEGFKQDQTSRLTRYEKQNENRNFYEKYLENPEQGILDYAEMLYNNDEAIKQSNVTFKNKGELVDPNARFLAEQLWEESKKQAKVDLEDMKNDRLITSRTFQEYDKPYYDAYKAEYAQFQNDPTQSSLLASAANSIFPSWFDERKARLQSAVDKANSVIEMGREDDLVSPAVSNYLASQPQLDKIQALEFINNNYADEVAPEILNQMEESINNMKEDKTITRDEILGIALSKVSLNRNNRTELQKAIELKTQIFNEQWKRSANTGGVIPQQGDEFFKDYKKELDEYLLFSVFEADDKVRKIGLLTSKINSVTTNDATRKIYIKQLREENKDTILTAMQARAANYLGNPLNDFEIDAAINTEKDKDEPRFIDRASYETFYYSQLTAQYSMLMKLIESQEEEDLISPIQ